MNLKSLKQDNHPDHEVNMAQTDTYHLAKQARELHDMLMDISEYQGLEGWQQSKITKAADYIDSVYKDISHNMAMDHNSDSDEEIIGENDLGQFSSENYGKLQKYLSILKNQYNSGIRNLSLRELNDIHRRILEVIEQLKSFKNRIKAPIDEGSMGGINRSHPPTDVSYENVLNGPSEDRIDSFIKGHKMANKIARDKESISYEERLEEYLNEIDSNENDYVSEGVRAIYLENLDIEIVNGQQPRVISEYEITLEGEEFSGFLEESLMEAEYQGRKVKLGKPIRSSGGPKKFHVFVKDPKTGNVKKVNFGDPNMKIKKSNPQRRKSFRARHNCDNPGPRTKARYWSCRKW